MNLSQFSFLVRVVFGGFLGRDYEALKLMVFD